MSRVLRYERLIRASPEQVFDAFTSPEGQRELYGTDAPGWIVESRCDLRVGGMWSISFGPGPTELYRHVHVFEEIDRPQRLHLTTTETRLDGTKLVTSLELTFEARGDATLMTWMQTGFPTDALRDEHVIGLPNAFDRLERALRGSRSDPDEGDHMSNSVLYMSMSLDGFIAGPDDDADHGLGVDGERLHHWLADGDDSGDPSTFRPSGPSGEVFDELMATGAVVVGRRTFDLAGHWNGDHHGGVPIFVPTRGVAPTPPSGLVHYVSDGVESAMRQAKQAAGDANVMVHGADLAQSCLRAGVLDELEIHLIPVLLGEGRRLFEHLGVEHIELALTRVIDAPGVTHLHYRVVR